MLEEIKGKRLEIYGQISIYEGFPYYHYEITEPSLTPEEKELKNTFRDFLTHQITIEDILNGAGKLYTKTFAEEFREKIVKPISTYDSKEILLKKEDYNKVKTELVQLIVKHFPKITNPTLIAEGILSESVGYGKIQQLLIDENLEEIMINGYEKNVFVFHRKYGHCKTNINYADKKELDLILKRIASTVGRKFDQQNPFIDARLPDGNRSNATYSFITPYGPCLTIRKFTPKPMSIIDLINKKTITTEAAAFLWLMTEGYGVDPMNIIVTGGSSSGKTTTLNALGNFIRYSERVITIEDTLELQLGNRDNWVQMEARLGISGQAEVTMDDLLKNSLRMRPDRLILGEVRGKEAETLFIAMDTGHRGCMGTLHSNSPKEMMIRLKNPPMNVSEVLLPLLNIIILQYRIYIKGVGIQRRVLSISEVTSMDQKPLIANIFEWDKETDTLVRTKVPSSLVEKLAAMTLKTKKEIETEITIRKKILEWMMKNNITAQSEVETIIQQYYYDPESILLKILNPNSE
ncbi:MAG: ATPase, T2SS/T4P/T4SS family [Candidatus Diapherotrites archaeon]